ncbi:MAG: dihydrolipoyllysine-residue acetyltransferase [Gammaproteobacteria bacterium]|nr:dihydrolipoyllysine-residue acetyltransferase [Gammaproteobacteria bacterium]
MSKSQIRIPDIGGAEKVDVIEVFVKPGDTISAEDSLITLEGDKATMEVPSPLAGTVDAVSIKVGDKVSMGDLILTVTADAVAEPAVEETSAPKATPNAPTTETTQEVRVPDIGDATDVDVIEVVAKVGDEVNAEDPLITLEGDKATMEVPSPLAGKVDQVNIKVGDKVSKGDLILTIKTTAAIAVAAKPAEPELAPTPVKSAESKSAPAATNNASVHAGPAVRRLAHELDINLASVKGSGEKGRITKEDIKKLVGGGASGGVMTGLPPLPAVDFSKFGPVETKSLSKIQKISGPSLHRNWVSIPHITQTHEADITELEAFRQEQKEYAKQQGVRLTPIAFIMKAVVAALKEFPTFNASLAANGGELILKKYFHIGVAVDTPGGLVVPVIRDVDKKSLFELAAELGEISNKARTTGLSMKDMSGGCFTISSLGGIGGGFFTPIINAPEVAILGVSRSAYKPIYQSQTADFIPRLMLPLSLSYDHRVIDGATGARFVTYLADRLADIRTLLL